MLITFILVLLFIVHFTFIVICILFYIFLVFPLVSSSPLLLSSFSCFPASPLLFFPTFSHVSSSFSSSTSSSPLPLLPLLHLLSRSLPFSSFFIPPSPPRNIRTSLFCSTRSPDTSCYFVTRSRVQINTILRG